MKKGVWVLCFVWVSAALLFAGGSKEDSSKSTSGEIPTMVLKLGHIAEPSHPYARGGDYFAELVKQKSGGKIEIKTFHSSQLGDQKSLIEGLIYGTIDLALVGTAALGQFQPQISLFDLPFLFDDLEHTYKSLDTVGMELGAALEPKGIKLLGYMENGIRHMTNNIREIKKPEDMKGLKIRVQTNKIFVSMMKALGASPTPMSLGELYSALQQGVVDGQENPAAHIYTQRFYEVQKYASLTAHAYAPEPLLISMKRWNAFPAQVQEIFWQAAKESIAWQRDLSKKEDSEYWDKIKATGKMKVTEVDRRPFMEATQKVHDEFADEVGRDNLARIKALKKG
ncbi:MAG TPA: DctP family TRAP transporter solute-binding subunit [Spirochaetales bacterium]|nr:DctP family TRAP transporter solute-binding subunit [Spirochaetales bacterium]